MKHLIAFIISFVLFGCGKPYSEQQRIAQVACAELRKTKEDEALQRLEIVNSAREELEEDEFIGDDSAVLRYLRWGMCEQFIINSGNYFEETTLREQVYFSLKKRANIPFEIFTDDGTYLVKVNIEHDEHSGHGEHCGIYLDTQTISAFSGHVSGRVRKNIYFDGSNMEYRAEFYLNNGKAEGFGRTWHDNGQLASQQNHNNGNLDGLLRRWDDNGQLEHEASYKNGQVSLVVNYKNGIPEGLARRWHDNGQLSFVVNYKNGKREGVIRRWHENGHLALEGNYKQGKAEGTFRRWHKNGKVITLSELQNNKSQ